MRLSFIILAWNSVRYLERCLASIRTALRDASYDYEVLVLDNGSQDGTAELLAEQAKSDPDHVFPHYEPTNLGTTKSRNILCRAARGEYLCIMDSDVEIGPGLFETLLPLFAADPQLGIVVPRIVYPNGMWQKSFDRFPTLGSKINRFIRLRAIEGRQAADMRNVTESFHIDYAISAFWLMPRSLLDAVGLLDEKIFYAPEDVDFCLRTWRAGYRVLYVPSVSIVHDTQEISRGFRISRAKLSHIKGLIYYFFKHRYFLRCPTFSHSGD